MQYRREVDGLRAIAVISVILYHAGFSTFGGGFIGVDVFLVISGYLITSIITEQLRNGTFNLLDFYERRLRRIAPALSLVIFCSIIVSYATLLPHEMRSFSQSVTATALAVSNMYFWQTLTYFAIDAEQQPLLHTWSLALEEQFYLLFPLLLMGAWRWGAGLPLRLMLALGLVSLLLAQYTSKIAPAEAFFLLHTRAWELLLGGSIAAWGSDGHRAPRQFLAALPSKIIHECLAASGFLLIALAVVFFDRNLPHPSIWTLFPALGTVLVIVFANASNATGRLLGSRLLVGIGLISYSAYLWHQPIFAFSRIYLREELDITATSTACALTFGLA